MECIWEQRMRILDRDRLPTEPILEPSNGFGIGCLASNWAGPFTIQETPPPTQVNTSLTDRFMFANCSEARW